MATIYKELVVNADPDFVWEAIRDVGALHKRLAVGLVVDTTLVGSIRAITFSNGYVACERIVSVDNTHRRLVCAAVGGRASHHNSSFQVFDSANGKTRLLWITDVLPDEVTGAFEQLIETACRVIKQTIEKQYASTEALAAF